MAYSRKEKERRRRRKAFFRQSLLALAALTLLFGVTAVVLHFCGVPPFGTRAEQAQPVSGSKEPVSEDSGEQEPEASQPDPQTPTVFTYPEKIPQTVTLTHEVESEYAILIDADTNTVLAEKQPEELIYPASMTKVLTLLVAAEHITDLDKTAVMSSAVIDPLYRQGATITGFRSGDSVSLRDLLYGGVLRSAADATETIAIAVAGSDEAFVQLMNDKLDELGLSQTAHFTNTSGLYNDAHVCTVRDMAVIMRAAMENPLCAQILSTENYTSAPTAGVPEGVAFSNKFLYRMTTRQPENVTVTAGKNGYVSQARSCLVSYAETADGHGYICVTASAPSSWKAISDHTGLYSQYVS